MRNITEIALLRYTWEKKVVMTIQKEQSDAVDALVAFAQDVIFGDSVQSVRHLPMTVRGSLLVRFENSHILITVDSVDQNVRVRVV